MAIVEDGRTYLTGDDTWPFKLLVDGADLVCRHVLATWFGNDNDPQDNGETACGYPTKGHPDLLGVALPCSGYGVPDLEGSPVPKLPFGLHADGSVNTEAPTVRVFCPATGIEQVAPQIDLGPGKQASSPGQPHGIDCTQALFVALGGNIDTGVLWVDYRIIGGAKYAGTA